MFENILLLATAIWAMPLVFYSALVLFFIMVAVSIDAIEDNSPTGGWTWSTIGSIGLLLLILPKFGITFDTIKEMPLALFLIIGAYFVAGTAWSFGKWYFHIAKIRDKYVELKEAFIKNRGISKTFLEDDPELLSGFEAKQLTEARQDFSAYIGRNFYLYDDSDTYAERAAKPALIVQSIKPLAVKHKSRITQWIAFWPISATWTIINDPVRKIVNGIFNRIKGVFQRISDNMFAGV